MRMTGLLSLDHAVRRAEDDVPWHALGCVLLRWTVGDRNVASSSLFSSASSQELTARDFLSMTVYPAFHV